MEAAATRGRAPRRGTRYPSPEATNLPSVRPVAPSLGECVYGVAKGGEGSSIFAKYYSDQTLFMVFIVHGDATGLGSELTLSLAVPLSASFCLG